MTSSHIFENPTELGTLTARNVRSKSPLAQVARKRQCDLVTDERLSGASTRNLWLWLVIFFFNCFNSFFCMFLYFIYSFFFIFFSPTTEFTLDVAKGLWLAFQSCIHSATVLEATCLHDTLDIPHLEVATTQWTPSASLPCQEPGQCKTGFFLLSTWYSHVEAGSDAEKSIHYIPLP